MSISRSTRQSAPWVEFLEGSLAQVESVLHAQIESPIRTISSVCERSLSSGGKRFRPALVILGALASDPDADIARAIQLGSAMELLHLATLLHDDVVDNAMARRGSPSANALSGNKVAILVGDYLLAKTFRILADDADQSVMNRMSTVTVALSEGQVLELVMRGTLGELESLYWKMIDRKTARLISACLEIGAMSTGAAGNIVEALGSFGERMGLVFQITDDILDLTGSSEALGKPVGADLLDGKVTLPYILALKEVSTEVRDSLLNKIFDRQLGADDIAYITDVAFRSGVPDRCLEMAREQVEIAMRHLGHIPVTPAQSILEDIGPYLLRRSA
ncbi:MAG: polyprenyl synthetase family protein [Armatimonadetes bacterium]|nr:polyprenyl synthetase family protein [Armatimonadota bacterium]